MLFIALTDAQSGEVLWVNMHQVVAIREDNNQTVVICNNALHVRAKEKVKDIFREIQSQLESNHGF